MADADADADADAAWAIVQEGPDIAPDSTACQ